jgi:hypothetical protein
VDRGKPSGAFLASKAGGKGFMQVDDFTDKEKVDTEIISFPEVSEVPVSWGEINIQRADKYKAIVNPEIDKVYSIVSKDYKLIRHEDAVQRIESTIDENLKLGKYKTSTEFYNDGGRMRMIYRFYEKSVEIKKGDTLNPELHLFNSYDTTWPFIVIIGAFRFVCANGLVVGDKYLYLRKRHVYHFDQMDINEQVSTALKRFKLQAIQWKKWTDRQLTEKTYENVMKTMKFGKKAMEVIEKRATHEAKDYTDKGFPIMNLWIFYNVLTWYITHRAVSLNHRVEMERRLRASMRHFKRA